MTRREMLAMSVAAAGGFEPGEAPRGLPEATSVKLPRWRGFNLLEKFMVHNNQRFVEQDFAWIAEWGMNFARLPMDYRCWIDGDWTRLREETLKEIDEAVAFGKKHGVHINMNFHRAPGYTVASPAEAKPIWTDDEALAVCCTHWAAFARRYKGIPNREMSFNLFNEPAILAPNLHKRVVERVAAAIWEQDPGRLIICDGRVWGNTPPTELVGLGVAAATRGYQPMPISHWKANWVEGSEKWAEPSYPLADGGFTWDKAGLFQRNVKPWLDLQRKGVGIMVGEFGAHNRTPHPVVLGWLRDSLANWKEAGWGWAMWNLRGSFGPVDSGRDDVAYEEWRGHKLDRAMLDLLRAS
jgi:endoglucanase